MRKFSIALALFCAVAASGVLGDPDADAAYRTYPEKIHKYGYTRSKLVLPYRRPWTYGGRNSPYGLHYTPDTYARRHYGFQKPAVRGLGVSRDFRSRSRSYNLRPTPVVKSYHPEPVVPYLEPAPAPAPVIHKTYHEPAPAPLPYLRRPIPTVRNIEVPVEKHYEYVEPAPAPLPVHETYVEPAPAPVAYDYVEPAPAPAPVAVHKTYHEPASPYYVEEHEPAYAVAEPAPLPAPAPAVPYYDEPAAAVPYYDEPAVNYEVASPSGRVVDSHRDGINLHGNREVSHSRTIAAVDHTAHHSDTVEHGPGFLGSSHVDHVDHGLHQVTAIEQSEHDLHRDREYHKITHEEVHPNLNGGPPIRKRITHGYKRPAPHVQTLYNRRIEVPVARSPSRAVHPGIAGHSIRHHHK